MSGLQTDVMSNTTQGLLYCLYASSAFFADLEKTRLQLDSCTPRAFLRRLALSRLEHCRAGHALIFLQRIDEDVQRGVSMANQFRETVIPRLTEVVGRELSGGVLREIGGGLVRGGRCPTLVSC